MDIDNSFSWSDSLRACFNSALSCLPAWGGSNSPAAATAAASSSHQQRRPARTENDELDRLLDTDTEDAVSLHSNISPGSASKRLRRAGRPKGRRIFGCFGYNFFWRRTPSERHGPIHLPTSVEGEDGSEETSALHDSSGTDSVLGTRGVDNSPTPLTDSRLEELSARWGTNSGVDEELRREEEELREREEMKAQRRMKRAQRKRASSSATSQSTAPLHQQQYQPPSPMRIGTSHQQEEDFGPFIQGIVLPDSLDMGPPPPPISLKNTSKDPEEDEEGMDLEAGVYTRPRSGSTRSARGSTASGSGSGSGSGSRPRSHSTPASHSHIHSKRIRSNISHSSDTHSRGSANHLPDPIPEEDPDQPQPFEGFGGELVLPTPGAEEAQSERKDKKDKKSKHRKEKREKTKSSKLTVTSNGSNNDSASLASPVDLDLFREQHVKVGDIEEGQDDADQIHGLEDTLLTVHPAKGV